MDSWLKNPAFHANAIACVVLCANLLFLWAFSDARRNQCKSTPNQEDAARFGAALSPHEAEPVARVLRAHRNAEASIYPFLSLVTVALMVDIVLTLVRGS